MESPKENGKLFIGGLSWDTNEETLKLYFTKYGQVKESEVIIDRNTGQNKGFGFVTFTDPSVIHKVLQDQHTILGRTVEVKTARPKVGRPENGNLSEQFLNKGINENYELKTKKIFVGGLPPNLTKEEFKNYFEGFGTVEDVVVMYDKESNRPRGFGFITFDSEEALNSVLQNSFHELKNKRIEVKRAEPKEKITSSWNMCIYDNSGLGFGPFGRVPKLFGGGFGGYPPYACPTPYGTGFGCYSGGINPYGLGAYNGIGYNFLNYYQCPFFHQSPEIDLSYISGWAYRNGWDRTFVNDVNPNARNGGDRNGPTSRSQPPTSDAPYSIDQQPVKAVSESMALLTTGN